MVAVFAVAYITGILKLAGRHQGKNKMGGYDRTEPSSPSIRCGLDWCFHS